MPGVRFTLDKGSDAINNCTQFIVNGVKLFKKTSSVVLVSVGELISHLAPVNLKVCVEKKSLLANVTRSRARKQRD